MCVCKSLYICVYAYICIVCMHVCIYMCVCVHICVLRVHVYMHMCVCMCVCMYVVSTNRLYRSKGVWLLSSGHKRHCFCPPLFNHAGRGGSGEGRSCHVVRTLKRLRCETHMKSDRSLLPTASFNLPTMRQSHLGNGTSSSTGAFRCETLIQDPPAKLLLSPDPQKL